MLFGLNVVCVLISGFLCRARDRPDKVHGIEIYDCKDYQRMRLHWNGCGLIMHELCHLLHQHALKDGLSNRTILDAYSKAKSSGLYEKTLRRDWAGQDEDTDLGMFLYHFSFA